MRVLIIFFGLIISLCCQAREQTPVEELILQRLALMKDVAAFKWINNLPVEDAAREEKVLNGAVQDGLAVGMTAGSARALFGSQIQAAREIQAYWFAEWRGGKSQPQRAPDLTTDIRPALLALGREIIIAAAVGYSGGEELFQKQLSVEGLSTKSRANIFSALNAVTFYSDRLTQILDSGYLRVGTTGDYEPFSLRVEGGEGFEGVDIDMARDLASALGVTPLFVETSWPSLMSDLAAGKFDIAMSGVSRTLGRQRHGFFSLPYHVGGKTALSRCSDKAKFQTLEDIDQPEVRVVVNPGGTNERFVNTRLRHAEKVVYEDNSTIFSQLIDREADVMITDRIEAEWQMSKNAALCLPVDVNFTYQEKAYLMPQDIALKEFVNTWLSLRIAENKLNPLLNHTAVEQ